ncbi:MAG: hypothetical protein ACREKE_08610, partial [bacterium]
WMPWRGRIRPYGRLGLGALAYSRSQADVAAARRPEGADTSLGLGVLLFADRTWGADMGLDLVRILSQPSLDLLQAHAGLLVRFGGLP